MDRTACVNLPELPLQLLLRRHPDWADRPAAVVDADKPQGRVLWTNDRARHCRVFPGMRYAEGLSLAADLRAAVVPAKDIRTAVSALNRMLHRFSPRIEPARDEPGVFWIDASGLKRLYRSLENWAACICNAMHRAAFTATVVVGFDRFGTYALAKISRGSRVMPSRDHERRAARAVPLNRLAVDAATRGLLDKLGINTVGEFIDLPAEAVAKRFDTKAYRLYRLATGTLDQPLQPDHLPAPAEQRIVLDHPETDRGRLMVVMARLLHPLLATLARRGRAVSGLHLRLCLERSGDRREQIRPAAPTLDSQRLLELIHLRLHAGEDFPGGVTEATLTLEDAPAEHSQNELFALRPARDPAAANRALARIRAGWGDHAVMRARLRDGHLPEAGFAWEPIDTLPRPAPCRGHPPTVIRRIYHPPRPLSLPDGQGRDRRVPPRFVPEPATASGPYVVSGGWWHREVHREYYFIQSEQGDLLWVYYDRVRQRWFLQGKIE